MDNYYKESTSIGVHGGLQRKEYGEKFMLLTVKFGIHKQRTGNSLILQVITTTN